MKEILKAGWYETILLLFDRLEKYRVEGNSMIPILKKGDEVLLNPRAKIRVGDIIVAKHPYKKSVQTIKRVKKADENGGYFLVGDNKDESTDSRTFGSVNKNDILGRVECRLK